MERSTARCRAAGILTALCLPQPTGSKTLSQPSFTFAHTASRTTLVLLQIAQHSQSYRTQTGLQTRHVRLSRSKRGMPCCRVHTPPTLNASTIVVFVTQENGKRCAMERKPDYANQVSGMRGSTLWRAHCAPASSSAFEPVSSPPVSPSPSGSKLQTTNVRRVCLQCMCAF